jgi:ABC-type branched-subunit amino acid transport system substrate-binding protein
MLRIRALLLGFLLAASGGPLLAQVGVTKNSILIGQSAAITGSQSGFGTEIRDGASAYFEEMNRIGGVHGRRIRLVTVDDGGNENKAKENTERLIKEEKVFALFGYISRPSALAGAKIASEAKVPFFAPFSGTPALYKLDRYVFTLRANYNDELQRMVDQLVATGIKRIAFVFLNDARQVNVPLVEKLLAKHGLKPAALIGVDRTSAEVGAQARELARVNPEAALALANNLPLTALVRESRKLGNATVFWIVSFVDSKLMVKELGPLTQGQVFAQVVPLPTKVTHRIVTEYQKVYRRSFPKAEFTFTSLEGYIGARTLVEGLKRAGRALTRNRLIAGLEAMRSVDFGGFVIEFSNSNHNASRYVDLTIVNKDGIFIN